MPHRVIRSRSLSRGPRRGTSWVSSADSTGTTALAAGAVILDSTFAVGAGLFDAPFTIVRTRGLVMIKSDSEAATETPFGALGMAVVSAPAAAGGVGSIPTPISEESSELWFLWEPFIAPVVFGSAVGINKIDQTHYFDSKAMRKVEDGNTVVFVLENASALHGLEYVIKFRMLIKLH